MLSLLMIFLLRLHTVHSVNGRLEVFLDNYTNPSGVTASGGCCRGPQTSSGVCSNSCRTWARVCVTVRFSLPSTGPLPHCDISDSLSSQLGFNNFSSPPSSREFLLTPQAWTGSFTLAVDLLHFNDWETSNSNSGALILRATVREDSYRPTGNWTTLHRGFLTFSFRFRCSLHFYGPDCRQFCAPRNDTHGHYSCSSSGARVCHEGYSGPYCDKPVCSCVHGLCKGPNLCACQPGWTGPSCNICQPLPNCDRGSCLEPFQCLCEPSYGGQFCNVDLEWCTRHPNPCENGGVCLNQDVTGLNYSCRCPEGFQGFHCEKKIFDCSKSVCLNSGLCDTSTGLCNCPTGFYGNRCELKGTTCLDNPCLGRGLCQTTSEGFQCLCEPGWSGRHCETNSDDCMEGSCLNGGRCVDGHNRFVCVCRQGFSGSRCQVDVNDCNSIFCLNGGVCRDQANSMKCECPIGFSGALCETASNVTVSKPLTSSSASSISTTSSSVTQPASSPLTSTTLSLAETLLISIFGFLLPLLLLLGLLFVASYRRFHKALDARRAELRAIQENLANELALQRTPSLKKMTGDPPEYSSRPPSIFYTDDQTLKGRKLEAFASFSVV